MFGWDHGFDGNGGEHRRFVYFWFADGHASCGVGIVGGVDGFGEGDLMVGVLNVLGFIIKHPQCNKIICRKV